MSDRKAVIKNADMSEEMQQDAVEYSILAIGKCNIEREIAALIKKVTTAVVKDTDMSEEMQWDAVEHAVQSQEEWKIEHEIAAHIKRISVCL